MSALESILSEGSTLVVTDTETTGIHARSNRIIEIAAEKVSPGLEREYFSELINPGISIPQRITRITGITTAMVFDKPFAEDVMSRYREFLEDGVFVAHNIRFDVSFVNAEFERAGLSEMDNRGLCTLRLARRLLPGLRSKSLGHLAKFFRIPVQGRHRAAKDVEITTQVLERLSQIACDDHGVTSLEELVDMQARTYAKVNPFSKHVVDIKRDTLPRLPRCPGVYFMKDGRDKILYVGKAKNLSQRVSSYFSAIEAHPPRLRQLISRVRKISWTEVDTELHALIEESREIKRLDPSFNRAQKKYIARPYLRLDTDDDFPRLTVQVIVRDDGAEYFGPLRSRGQARTLVEIVEKYYPLRNCSAAEFARGKKCVRADIGRCGAPCEGKMDSSSYASVVDEVRSFLSGDVEDVCMDMERGMLEASESHAFEEAARLRDWIQFLEERLIKNGVVAEAVSGPEHVHYLSGENDNPATLVMVSGGRVSLLEAVSDEDDIEDLFDSAFESSHDEDDSMNRIHTDARRVLDHWLYANRTSVVSALRREGEEVGPFVFRTVALIAMHEQARRESTRDAEPVEEADSFEKL